MDYTKKPLAFKVRKAVRYVAKYGISRTLFKIQGQYHMARRYGTLPQVRTDDSDEADAAILGCGNFAYTTIAYYLRKNYGNVIRGTMDSEIHRAASLFDKYRALYFTDDASKIISDPRVKICFIASNHASHAEYAIAALHAGKAVHIEKPHVVSESQLDRLCHAMVSSGGLVHLGFNRPQSSFGRRIRHALQSQSGPSMVNWFIAGHEIEADHWYFAPQEGGRILGNLCHWTDFCYQLVEPENRFPIRIIPTRSQRSDCDIAVTYVFGDGGIAAITFSAKGHTFEGVRERFAAHRGNVLIAMDDYERLTIEIVEHKKTHVNRHRDHGHEGSICDAYRMVHEPSKAEPHSVAYVWETAQLFLKTKEALEENCEKVVTQYDHRYETTVKAA